jgi:anti-sigma factor RsiW
MTEPPARPCADVLRQVSAYLDQELDADVCHKIEAHCTECRDCAHVVAGLKETIGLCRATGQRPLPANVRAKAQASIQALLTRARR